MQAKKKRGRQEKNAVARGKSSPKRLGQGTSTKRSVRHERASRAVLPRRLPIVSTAIREKKRPEELFGQFKLPLRPRKLLEKAAPLLAPLPVVMVSSARSYNQQSKQFTEANIATFAWSGIVNSDPPCLSISCRPERYTYDLIQASQEFVVNLVDEALVTACDFCGVRSLRSVDKFQHCQLSAELGEGLQTAPAIAESPVSLSCRVKHQLTLGSHDLIVAEIVAVKIANCLFDEKGGLKLQDAQLVAYQHGQYVGLGEMLGFFGFSVAKDKTLSERL